MADEQQATSDPWASWRSRIQASRRQREDRIAVWRENVDRRKGEPRSGSGQTTTRVNKDWSLTKAKCAQLYSQTPEIRLTPREGAPPPIVQAVPGFGRRLNDTLKGMTVGDTIGECLVDVINASGIGGVIISCEKLTEVREVPAIDPQMAAMSGMLDVPTMPVQAITDVAYLSDRVSPGDLLVPSDFTGSNYDHARWLGHDGRMTWPQGKQKLKLTEEQKEKVLSGDLRRRNNEQTLNTDTNAFHDGEYVHFTQLFYWRHYYHEEETNFYALQRMVFVDGLEEPVINEEYQGQARQPDGSIVGMRRNPIQVLTLTYISDDPLPPSDSTIGRPQVDELEASRDAMVQQRKHSIPIRWFDPNRVSANTRALLEKGTYQGLVPTNGPGDRAIGEVARATYPAERFEFDRVINSDLSEGWQVGSNQAGNFASGERSASEARIIQQNFQTRVGQERDKVTRFLVNISECIAGLIAIHGGEYGLPKEIAGQVTYDVRVDSTVRMDAESRIAQLDAFVNKWAQSGFLNPKVIAQEWADLAGIPPEAIVDPQPKGPEPVKLSVSKAEDLASPLFLACLMATNQAPSPEHIAAAVRLLNEASMGIVPIIPPQAPESEPVGDNVKRPGIQNADWQEQPRINKRDEDGGA